MDYDKCVRIFYYLKELHVFPLELVKLITNLCWRIYNVPILVIYLTNDCHNSKRLKDLWYGRDIPNHESIGYKLSTIYPDLEVQIINSETFWKRNSGLLYYDDNALLVPWSPFIMLIRKFLWDRKDIHSNDDIYVFNGKLEDERFRHIWKYDYINIIMWIQNYFQNTK